MTNLNLSDSVLVSLNDMYGEELNSLDASSLQIDIHFCSCSGDCGSDWMRS